jgi:multiple sugar transport system ATP-binding protein
MQRVSIGQALVHSPNIYLMDEPLSSLDAKLREELRVELKRIQIDTGATILYVTHDQLEAMTLADRIGILRSGELIQIDVPRKVYEAPVNVYAAKRLGSPQINLVSPDALSDMNAPVNTVQVGLRPEDIVLGKAGDKGIVNRIEFLGVETVVSVDVGATELHALVPVGHGFKPGDATDVSWKKGKEVFFDEADRRIDTDG